MSRLVASFLLGVIVMFAIAYLAVILFGILGPGSGSRTGLETDFGSEIPIRRSNLLEP